ncbi:MAG: LacI family DNA-binding transcriptional regulator [Opitutaceae bacterium]|nr:LacI family DNA-binding transcriptional regulator [Opitutaceae bacterium]
MSLIAERAGVSKNTVSLALRHDPQIPVATRERIERIAAESGYAKNPVVAQLMTELRKVKTAGFRRTLALLNANLEPKAFARHPTIPAYVAGCRRRAAQHGYALDEFWLHDPEMYGERLNRVLKARGIRGVIVAGLMNENRLPTKFSVTWQQHAVVVTGVRTHEPTLSFACVDHHALVLEAMEQARRLGYRRPALVLAEGIDRLVEGRFSAGFWAGQRGLAEGERVPGFYDVEAARAESGKFHAWWREWRPDVIFTLHTVVREWLESAGVRAPRDVGLIQLERRKGCEDWAGMDQHNDLTGEAAVDMLVSLINNNEAGVPAAPRATLVGGSWVEGATVKGR